MSNKTESILYKDLDKESRHFIFRVLRNGDKSIGKPKESLEAIEAREAAEKQGKKK